MKSITIHNLHSDLACEIEKRAKEQAISQNQFIKRTLRKALDLDDEARARRIRHFDRFFGSMSKDEADEFFRSTEDLSKIDLSQW